MLTRLLAPRLGAAAWAAAADLAWHLLGPAWTVGLLAAMIAWIAGLVPQMAVSAAQASAKAYAVEDRLGKVVGKIPSPQASPGSVSNSSYGASDSSSSASNSSYGASNSSYGMSGGTGITYNSGSGNQGGGPGSVTSGQIGGAPQHNHDMTHYHTNSNDLQSIFNALRGSHSDLVPAVNALRASHSDLVPTVNALRNSHGDLVDAVNALRGSHSTLLPQVNTLVSRLEASGLLT